MTPKSLRERLRRDKWYENGIGSRPYPSITMTTVSGRRFLATAAFSVAATCLRAQSDAGIQVTLTIPTEATGPHRPADFVGLSYEVDPTFFSANNTGLIQEFKALAPRGVLRLGGNTLPGCTRQRHQVRQEIRGSGAEGSAVCVDGETEPGGDSPTRLLLRRKVKLQVPPLRFASVGMTNLRVAAHLGGGGGGWTKSANKSAHTHPEPTYALD
jgi:hypothetical protein